MLSSSTPQPVRSKAQQVNVARVRSTADGAPVFAFELRPRDSSGNGLPHILFLHGNAADVGELMSFLWQLAGSVSCNVLAVEYQAFGQSGGSPSIASLRTDAEASLRWLEKHRNARRSDIVVYGQSIGTHPALLLATNFPGLRGVVLHSPMLSALSVLSPNRSACSPVMALRSLDVLSNERLAPHVTCPVFLLHGADDVEIPISHAQRLLQFLPNELVHRHWFAQGAGHNDLSDIYFAFLISYLWQFVHGTPFLPRFNSSRSRDSTCSNDSGTNSNAHNHSLQNCI